MVILTYRLVVVSKLMELHRILMQDLRYPEQIRSNGGLVFPESIQTQVKLGTVLTGAAPAPTMNWIL